MIIDALEKLVDRPGVVTLRKRKDAAQHPYELEHSGRVAMGDSVREVIEIFVREFGL